MGSCRFLLLRRTSILFLVCCCCASWIVQFWVHEYNTIDDDVVVVTPTTRDEEEEQREDEVGQDAGWLMLLQLLEQMLLFSRTSKKPTATKQRYEASVFWIPAFQQQRLQQQKQRKQGKKQKSHGLQQSPRRTPRTKSIATVTTKTNEGDTDSLASAMDDVVRLLLPSDNAEAYIQQYPARDFRFYVYDNLPANYSWSALSTCIEQTFNVPNWLGAHIYGNATSNCDWGSSICAQTTYSSSKYSTRRYNRNGDAVLSQLFLQYHGSLRTYNPAEADLFIVPYASSAHCMCENPKISRCNKVKATVIQQDILSLLHHHPYYNVSSQTYNSSDYYNRHLFFNSAQRDIANSYIRKNFPLQATLEPREQNCPLVHATAAATATATPQHDTVSQPSASTIATTCGHIAMPYVNTHPDYQPNSNLVGKRKVKRIRDRKYALVAILSLPKGMDDRAEFQSVMEQLYNRQSSTTSRNNATWTPRLARRPILVSTLSEKLRSLGQDYTESMILQQLYQDSIFCPCLPGDTPNQKRFYDAWMSGCIPVVLQHDVSHEPGYPSWYRRNGTSIRLVHPFAQGVFANIIPFFNVNNNNNHNNKNGVVMGLNYSQMVVTINGTCGIAKCLLPTLQHWLTYRMDELQRIQNNIVRVSRLFSYGLQHNAMRYPDAVAGILVQARHYLLFQQEEEEEAQEEEQQEE